MTYYKILHLPTASYLQSLIRKNNPRYGTVDTVFLNKEDAEDRLRCKLVYETDVDDIDNPTFLFSHFNIEEYEGEPPEQVINNVIDPTKGVTSLDWGEEKTGNLGLR